MSINQIKALYEIPTDSLSIKLFDNAYSKIIPKIIQLIIDNLEIKPTEYYTFKTKGIHSLQIILSSELNSLQNLFSDCFYLKEVDFSNLSTSKVTSMANLFYRCISLSYIDFTNVDTSNVLDIQKMFLGCGKLKVVDLSMFNTSKVKDMNNLFSGCSTLKRIFLS